MAAPPVPNDPKSGGTLPYPLPHIRVLLYQQQYEKALHLAENAIVNGLCDAEVFHAAARAAMALKLLNKAEHYWKEALTLKPNLAEASFYLGVLYGMQDRLPEALSAYEEAVKADPNLFEAQCNLGNIYFEEGRLEEAEVLYRQVIAAHADWVSVKNNLSYSLLARERFEEGWLLREVRYDARLEGRNSDRPPVPFPQWQGQNLEGKSIVVWDEQGFGDVIQFVRYIKILKEKGATKITFVCRKELKTLFETLSGVDRVAALDTGEKLEPHDYWVFPLSLPIFHKTTRETIPADVGYLSTPEKSRKKWQGRVPEKGLRVGLVWKGSTKHKKDRERSLPSLEMLRPLWEVKGVTFISLQKGQGEDEATAPPEDMPILHLGSALEDFSDTAAILEQIDLLISVDTAAVHLAGALGKPAWVLVTFLADWRWLLDRDDSPWYPSVRLFRQKKRHDWAEVIERIKTELARLAA